MRRGDFCGFSSPTSPEAEPRHGGAHALSPRSTVSPSGVCGRRYAVVVAETCTLPSGEVVDASTALADCAPAPGAVLRFSDDVAPALPPPVPLSRKVVKMPEPTPVAVAPVEVAPVLAPAAPVALTETKAPAPAAPTPQDVAGLVDAGGGGAVGLAAALLAVAGGGAAWRFYSQRSEQAHELAKEKLKMEQAAQGLNGAQPPPCQAANAALEQRVAALVARVEAAEAKADAAAKRGASLSADFDGEALERQVKRLTKAVKEMQEDKV